MDCKNKELVGEERRKKKEERRKRKEKREKRKDSCSAAVLLLFPKHLRYILLDLLLELVDFHITIKGGLGIYRGDGFL